MLSRIRSVRKIIILKSFEVLDIFRWDARFKNQGKFEECLKLKRIFEVLKVMLLCYYVALI